MPYVTGGFAYGRTDHSYSENDDGDIYNYSYGATHTGWTAGGGVEYAITNNLTLKIEGLYTDLGNNPANNVYEGYETYAGYYTRTECQVRDGARGLNWKLAIVRATSAGCGEVLSLIRTTPTLIYGGFGRRFRMSALTASGVLGAARR